MHLTEKSVQKLTPGAQRKQIYEQQGFGIRVETNGRKSFFWLQKVNGKPRFRALGDHPQTTVAEARAAALELSAKAANWKKAAYAGENPFAKVVRITSTDVPTFKELCEAYIRNHIHSSDENERANHPDQAEYRVRWKMKKHYSQWLDRPLDQIALADVAAVKAACGEKKFAANRAVEFVRALYNWCGRSADGKVNFWPIVRNPAADITTFAENERERYLTPTELVRFNEALKKETHADLKDFLILAMNTGARKSDIFSMRWQDIQFETQMWRVPFPKGGESYNVQLLPAALEVLRRRESEKTEDAVFVFPGPGKSKHLLELRKPWGEFRKRAQIPDVRVHDLRRTVGSFAAISGASLQTIGAMLGHKSMQSTLIYAKLCDESTRDARETGQAKMLQMMATATRRAKLVGKKPKAITSKRPKLLFLGN